MRLRLVDVRHGFANVHDDGVVVGYVQLIENCGRWFAYTYDDDSEPVMTAGHATRREALEALEDWFDGVGDAPDVPGERDGSRDDNELGGAE